jgi:hypothetical protein
MKEIKPVIKQKLERRIISDLFEYIPSENVEHRDLAVVRDLARKVKEISETDANKEKIRLIRDNNSLKKTRPVVLCFPENGYREIIPPETLQAKNPFLAEYEFYLRALIYHSQELDDDYPITSRLKVPMVFDISSRGIEEEWGQAHDDSGAAKVTQVIKDEDDIDKLQFPSLSIDDRATTRNLNYVDSVFGDILDVRLYKTAIVQYFVTMGLMGYLARARGMDQIFLDMYDRPRWVHKGMQKLLDGMLFLVEETERMGLLGLNNADDYIGTGGLGYTHDLPRDDFDGSVRLLDLWGFRETQEMQGLSPGMFEEFVIPYEIKYLEKFGLNYYGCCEDLSRKFKLVKKIPRLRRVSVAPWTDMKIASEELEDRYVYVWKPNPSILAMETFDEDLVRKTIKNGFEVSKHNIVNIIMKDTHTFRNEPERLKKWCAIAKELSLEYG